MGDHADAQGAWLDGYVERQKAEAVAPVQRDLDVAQRQVADLGAALQGANTENGRLQRELEQTVESLQAALARIAELEAQQPGPKRYPVYAHSLASAGNFYADVMARPWATGAFAYWPGPWKTGMDVELDAAQRALVSQHPDGIDLIVSPKEVNPTTLMAWADWLVANPKQLERTVYCWWQEYEDDAFKGKTAEQAAASVAWYRDQYARARAILAPRGIRCGVEVQEYTIDPANTAWGGEGRLYSLIGGLVLDEIHWSLYLMALPASWDAGVKEIRTRVDRIASYMERRHPGVPWEISAAGIALPANPTTAQRQFHARLVGEMYYYSKAKGSRGFGYFDVDFTAQKGIDFRVLPDALPAR